MNRFELGVGHRIDEVVILKIITQIARSHHYSDLSDEIIAIQLSTIY